MKGSQGTCLIFDPFAGASGDMILGGLIDVGLPPEWLQELVTTLGVSVKIDISTVQRGALSATKVTVDSPESEAHRQLDDVLEILERAAVAQPGKELAMTAFRRLAEAEGAIHGQPPEKIHFHEVGAVDAIVDVIGATAGITELGVAACYSRPVAIGRGWVSAAHGQLPLPAPATLKLLEGLPVCETGLDGELTTPTGAALLATLTAGKRAPGQFTPLRSGYGAGSRDPSSHANCLRIILAEIDAPADLVVIQADIDDMSPEYVPPAIDALFDAGAIDVWTHAIQMKKGRTGLRLEALAKPHDREAVGRALLAASSTIGLRYFNVSREVLPRTTETLEWRGFLFRVKTTLIPDGHVRRKVEYEDVIQAARESGIPPWQVREEVERKLSGGNTVI